MIIGTILGQSSSLGDTSNGVQANGVHTSNGVQSNTKKPVQFRCNLFSKLGEEQNASNLLEVYRNMSAEEEHTSNVVQSDTSKRRLRVLSRFHVFSPKALDHGDRMPLIGTQPPQN